jgi:hypothetical protein
MCDGSNPHCFQCGDDEEWQRDYFLCNGRIDCFNGYDELEETCKTTTTTPAPSTTTTSTTTATVQCGDYDQWIPEIWFCDGFTDCGNGYDELGEVCGWTTETTTTATTTTTTTATTTTTTTTTETTTTTTTTTRFVAGRKCASDAPYSTTFDSECVSSMCRTHCCNDQTTDSCSFCSNDGGSCYAPLAIKPDWDPTTALNVGWKSIYNKDEKAVLDGPPADFISTTLTNVKGEVRFRLMWSATMLSVDDFNTGTPPLTAFVAAGEGADPGLFDFDLETRSITALPRRNGNYTLFFIADDSTAGTAAQLGLPAQLDQVIVKRWDFTVIGKPDFEVTSYARKDASTLPPVASGEDPYITDGKVGSIQCTVGTMYHIAPISAAKGLLVYDHASGGEGATIRFTIRNPPPGFFIEPNTGEIQGNPQAASAGKTYKSTLLAVDPAGQQAVLENMVFTILAKPRFVPVFEPDRTTASSVAGYTDPTVMSADQPFVVGTSYKIATFVLNASSTKVSAGEVNDITYTLSSNAPESFCVQAKSGDISGTFPTAGNYSFGVLAVDQAGATAVVEQFEIVVLDRPVFEISVGSSRVRSSSDFTNPSAAASSAFYINESYRFSPLELLRTATIVSAGSFDDITFTLVAEDGWFVSAQSGEIFGQFGSVGNHVMSLFAVDAAGKQALVEQMRFVVQSRSVFGLGTTLDPSMLTPEDVGLESTTTQSNPPRNIQYAIDSTIKFPPLLQSTSELFVNPAFDDFTKITYKRAFGGAEGTASGANPGLWLVDTETGQMLAQPERAGNYSVSLTATDGLGAEVAVRSWQFEVLLRDTDVTLYGPNNRDCENNGVRTDDLHIFNQHFTCTCFGTGHKGDNCEIKILPAVCANNEALVAGVCKPFQLAVNLDGTRTEAGTEYTDPTNMRTQYYTVREFASYRIAPLAINDLQTNYSSGNQSQLTYTMVGDAEGFFLNTQTGQMLGTFDNFEDKAATQTYSIILEAVDASGVHQDLENLTMRVRYPDLEVDEFGPNNQVCENNATRMDGFDNLGDKFDQSYVCKCSIVGTTSFSGDNCEIATTAPLASVAGDDSSSVGTVAGGLMGAVVFVFCVGLILYKRRMHAIKMQAFDFEAEISRLITAGEIDADDEAASRTPREVKRTNVTMTEMIGEGAFGEVWKAVLDESSAGGVPGYMVAVKTSKETKGEGAEEMLREATVMAQVSGHSNLVSLIGVVTSGAPLLLLLSLCENGSLLSYLKKQAQKGPGTKPLTLAERTKMALDTARGMEHLTANKFVHRDLAARNVLIDALKNCKVADFGLARGIAGARAGPETNEDGDEEEYYRSRTGTFPVRWTAPEAMQTMRFTEGSDAWSFGITMIEVFTDGGKPYANMDNAAVISKVQGGYRAPQPKLCPAPMYAIMLACWHAKAAERPTFETLVGMIQGMQADGGGGSILGASTTRSVGVANANYSSAAEGGTRTNTEPLTVHDLGTRVSVVGYECKGTLKFVGMHHEKGTPRCGVQLDEPLGKSRGTFGGHEYFEAPKKTGVLVPVRSVSRADHPPSSKTGGGAAARTAVVANATYATGGDVDGDVDDEYLSVASGLAAAVEAGTTGQNNNKGHEEDQYLAVSQQTGNAGVGGVGAGAEEDQYLAVSQQAETDEDDSDFEC